MVFYIDAFPHEDWIKQIPVKKHGNHDQKSHGNWARGSRTTVTDWASTKKAIQAALPNAHVYIDDSEEVGVEYMQGIVDGFEEMAEKYPSTAANLVSIQMGKHVTTHVGSGPLMAEMRFTKVRPIDEHGNYLPTESGIGLYFDTRQLQDKDFQWSIDNPDRNEWRGGDDYERVITNSWRTSSKREWARDIVVHEFGHAVHSTALSKRSGESFFNGVLRNDKLWFESLRSVTLEQYSAYDDPMIQDWGKTISTNLGNGTTIYSRRSRAEMVAEAFVARHGGRGTVHPEMNRVLAEMEAYAK